MAVKQNSINANANTPLSIPQGGSGGASLTGNGILYGNGTSAIQSTAALTNGQLVIGSTSNPPATATLTAGSNIAITNAAGSITINAISNTTNLVLGDFSNNPWQRGTSFTAVANGSYTADEWGWVQNGTGSINITQTADAPTISQAGYFASQCLNATVGTAQSTIAAGNYFGIAYPIEGYDFTAIAQQPFTLSFWVKSSITGTYCVGFKNNGPDSCYIGQYTINTANTWQQVIINVSANPTTGTWNYTTGIGLQLVFTLAAGTTYQGTVNTWNSSNVFATSSQVNFMASTSNSFRLALVQLQIGSNATSYIFSEIANVLQYCNRYYWKTFPIGTAPAQNAGVTGSIQFSQFVTGAVTTVSWPIFFPVVMRTTPSITLYNPSNNNGLVRDITLGADTTATSVYSSSEKQFSIQYTTPLLAGANNINAIHATSSATLTLV